VLSLFPEKTMQCTIYKGHKKPNDYLYVAQADDFSCIPEALLEIMGELTLVLSLELSAERPLAQADVQRVMLALTEQGYYLQIPPKTHERNLMDEQKRVGKKRERNAKA
jgi:uncharacterized protein